MNWLNVEVATIRRPEYVGADPCHRATWWNLLVYCVEQENGGVISDCGDWKCRRWQQTCGVTKDEVENDCSLWELEDGNVAVWGYPSDKEAEVKAKRLGGSIGGKKRAENAALKAAKTNPSSIHPSSASSIHPSSASSSPSSSVSTEEKRREEKKIEREREEAPLALPEVVPTGRRFSDHAAIIARINAVRPEWKKPAQWTASELHALHDSLGAFEEMTSEDWVSINRYMAARLPEGAGYWQPPTRSRFVSQFSDVMGHVQRWEGKRRPSPTISKPSVPVKEREILTREQLKEMMQP